MLKLRKMQRICRLNQSIQPWTFKSNYISILNNNNNYTNNNNYVRLLSSKIENKELKHFITLRDFSSDQIKHFIQRAANIKVALKNKESYCSVNSDFNYNNTKSNSSTEPLHGKTLAMIFTKKSTRTRISSESGWAWFGGHPMFLGASDIQLSGGEPLKDTSIVVSSMVDCILARVGEHEEILTLAQNSSVPVINALTAKYHPLQALADILTLYETLMPTESIKKNVPNLPPLKIAWVGDSNNIINSLLMSLPRLGPIHLKIATPAVFPIDAELLKFANETKFKGSKIETFHSAKDAVREADILVTDTWVSMGQEDEYKKRLEIFKGFQITEELCKLSNPNWKFMHCLPRKKEEVCDSVFYNKERSLVWQEAENRKYTVMAVYEWIMNLK